MFAVEREFDIEATIIDDQGEVITLRTTHKWPGASANWRQPDGQHTAVSVGLKPVIFDRRPDHLAAEFAHAIGAELCASEDDYRAAVDRARKVERCGYSPQRLHFLAASADALQL